MSQSMDGSMMSGFGFGPPHAGTDNGSSNGPNYSNYLSGSSEAELGEVLHLNLEGGAGGGSSSHTHTQSLGSTASGMSNSTPQDYAGDGMLLRVNAIHATRLGLLDMDAQYQMEKVRLQQQGQGQQGQRHDEATLSGSLSGGGSLGGGAGAMGMTHESGSGASEEAEHAAWQRLMMAGNPAPGPGMLGQEESSVGLLTGNSVGPDQDDYRTTSAVLNALTLNTKALAKGREKKRLSQQHQVRQLRQAQGPIRPLWIQYTPRDNQ
jgi:hypothetical protein